MKISRDAWLLIGLLIAFCVGSYYITIDSLRRVDSPSSYSTGKRGMKAMYLLLRDLGFRVGRNSGSFDALPSDARVLFLVDPMYIPDKDAKSLAKWVKRGNTLILALSNSMSFHDSLGAVVGDNLTKSPSHYLKPKPGKYSTGVQSVYIDAPVSIWDGEIMTTIVRDKSDLGDSLIAEYNLGRGRVIFVCDPLFFSNLGIREKDNVVLAVNFVYENANKGDLVLFAEYKPQEMQGEKLPPLLGRGGILSLALIGFVALLLLISHAQRFGAIHPLPEREEKRRGWELVRAMAGLYRRAEAREVALSSVYQSFWRELVTKFGVAPSASADDAANTILRSEQVDCARLAALLSRCKRIADEGEKISDGEALMLAKSIEEFRRELGIARPTNN